MYTFGRLGINLLNIKKYNVLENDIVIFCFGEIDCRNHVHKHITKDKTYEEVINEIVEKYFIAIKDNVCKYNNLKVYIYNVVPPIKYINVYKNHPFPYLGNDEERKKYYLYMNKKLKEYCNIYNYLFFDIYDNLCDKNGFLKI